MSPTRSESSRLARREVHRDRQRRVRRPPARRHCSSAVRSTNSVIGPIRPRALGDRHELVGRDEPFVWVRPAHERLHADDAAGRHIDLRLVMERAARDCRSRCGSSPTSRACAGCARRGPRRSIATPYRGFLAAYIATSARRRSVDASRPCPGDAMPIEAETSRSRSWYVERTLQFVSARFSATAPRRPAGSRRGAATRTRRRRGGPPSHARRRARRSRRATSCSRGRRLRGRACR